MHEVITLPGEFAAFDAASGEVVLHHDGSPPAVMRERIDALVQRMLATDGAGMDLHVEHTVEDGMYMRKMFIPKGTLIAGKIHLQACINVVAAGDITVLTEYGCRRVAAGFTGVSQRGIQKIGFAHEDTIFINVFRTDETVLDRIEAAIAGTEHVPVGVLISNEESVCQSDG